MLGDNYEDDTDFVVMRCNWMAIEVFCALGSLWKADPMSGRYYGIDRSNILSTFSILGIPQGEYRQIFGEVQVMESEAMKVLNRGR